MKRDIFYVFLTLMLVYNIFVHAQNITLTGVILQEKGLSPIANAHVYISKTNSGSFSLNDGYFNLKIPPGSYSINISHVGYQSVTRQLHLVSDTLIEFLLDQKNLAEAKIIYQEPVHKQALLGKTTISAEQIALAPSTFTEPDIIKTLAYLPGVTTSSKGFSTLNVRGGSREGNLILLDNAPLQASNHLFGFLSSINIDALKDVDFYKGGFPARFGGRSSSVIDLQTREGNKDSLSGNFDLGLLYSKILFEGPIKNGKTSFLFSARASYLNLFLFPFKIREKSGFEVSYPQYNFNDIYAGIHHRFNSRNNLKLSFYQVNDIYRVLDRFGSVKSIFEYNQNTRLLTLNYSSILSPKINLKVSSYFTQYNNRLSYDDQIVEENGISERTFNSYDNSLNSFSIKPLVNVYFLPEYKLSFGVEAAYFTNYPAEIDHQYYVVSAIDTSVSETRGRNESAIFNVFLENEFSYGNIRSNIGVRYANYTNKGIKDALEPRVSFRWLIHPDYSIKAGYSQMNQYQHQINNNYQGVGSEMWMLSKPGFPAQHSELFSAGFFGNPKEGDIDFGVEVYYRTMKNLLYFNYVEIGEIPADEWEQHIHSDGKGTSYGLELQANMNRKKYFVNLAYTLAYSNRQFQGINHGRVFPDINNRRHDFSLLSGLQLPKKRTLGVAFVYNTGTPISLPEAYVKENNFSYEYYVYGTVNNYRLPPYHRLDISYTKGKTTKRGRESYKKINIYNVYARQNPVSINFRGGKVYQVANFSILPTISYGIKF